MPRKLINEKELGHEQANYNPIPLSRYGAYQIEPEPTELEPEQELPVTASA